MLSVCTVCLIAFTLSASAQESRNGCIAVKPVGSHAFRNIMLGGLAGALVSKEQYEILGKKNYPVKIGDKFHGDDLKTMQSAGTRVLILSKNVKKEEAARACEQPDDQK